MKTIHLALLILVGLSTMMPVASAGTDADKLYVTNASNIPMGSNATVSIYITNDFEPKISSYHVRMFYVDTVVRPISYQKYNATNVNINTAGYVIVNGFTTDGYSNGDLLLATVTLESQDNEGRVSELGMYVQTLIDIDKKPLTVSIQNGTFKTKDEVPPEIDLTMMPKSVSSTFDIVGTIHEVGGMGTAQATLENKTHTEQFDLALTGPDSNYNYTFSKQVTWPVEDGVTLTVTATDDERNTGTETHVFDVVDVGFSKPEPTGYINVKPDVARVFMSQMNKGTVGMTLGSVTYGPISLGIDTTTDYAEGTLPKVLPDDEYWVNVSGIDNFGDARHLNWTFTLDTIKPVITKFDIADSDGDGYIEAGEDLYLSWSVTELNFDRVALMDVATSKELWNNTAKSGSKVTVQPIDVGNRDLAFRAYDKAGNYNSSAFHLYNNYMIWVNSTKVGKVSGIDTTYTAVKDLSRTNVSSIKLLNGRAVTLPALDQLQKNVINVGPVTSDTYVTVDEGANATVLGSETYSEAWVYDPNKNLDFQVKVPHVRNATLVLAEANESYIAELIRGGKGGMGSIDYMDLIKKTVYVFIDGGWAEITVMDDGTINPGKRSGNSLSISPSGITATLKDADNQVDLDAGYQLSTQKDKIGTSLDPITLPPGDYALAAIAMDDDRIGILAAMPVIVMESETQGTLSTNNVVQGDNSITAKFDTPCERLGVVLIRDVTYKGNALIDAVTLGKDTLYLNLTYDDIPATQKLIGNVYVSPSSGKYVVANTNQATISTSGLEPGSYRVYMVGQSANGTVQAFGQHVLTIKPSVDPTPTPTPYTPGGGGGGGGGGSSYTTYTGTGTLKVNNAGTVLKSIKVGAGDSIGSLFVPIGTTALDKDGNPLTATTLTPLASGDLPAVPSGALFSFAGYIYEAGPAGATFDPAITLTFDIPESAWNALDPDNNDFKVKWYNTETREWEDVATTVFKSSRSIDAAITHFSIFALFTEPVTTPTEPVTPTTPTEPPTTPPAEGDLPADGFPMTTILVIFAVLVIVIAAGYFFMVRK